MPDCHAVRNCCGDFGGEPVTQSSRWSSTPFSVGDTVIAFVFYCGVFDCHDVDPSEKIGRVVDTLGVLERLPVLSVLQRVDEQFVYLVFDFNGAIPVVVGLF